MLTNKESSRVIFLKNNFFRNDCIAESNRIRSELFALERLRMAHEKKQYNNVKELAS